VWEYDFGRRGVSVKAKTREPIIRRLNQEIVRYLKTPEAKDLFEKSGADIVARSPEELGTSVKTDLVKVTKLLKTLNVLVN
jgi:tripartite-type tricarboxylate transporter receptor subunit TctC